MKVAWYVDTSKNYHKLEQLSLHDTKYVNLDCMQVSCCSECRAADLDRNSFYDRKTWLSSQFIEEFLCFRHAVISSLSFKKKFLQLKTSLMVVAAKPISRPKARIPLPGSYVIVFCNCIINSNVRQQSYRLCIHPTCQAYVISVSPLHLKFWWPARTILIYVTIFQY